MRGRPRKPASSTALAWENYVEIALRIADNYVKRLKQIFPRNGQLRLDLRDTLEQEALVQLEALCRRFDSRKYDQPRRYLFHFLPKRIRPRFDLLVKEARTLIAVEPLDANFAYRESRTMKNGHDIYLRALVALSGDEDEAAVRLLDAARIARSKWTAAVDRLRVHVAGLRLPEAYEQDVVALVNAVAAPAAASVPPTPATKEKKSLATKEHK